jgi:hypothetical protein
MEYFGIFCGHLVNFPVIWYILWPFGMLVLKWEMLVYFVAIWSIFWSFGIFSGHLVYFVAIWYVGLEMGDVGIFCGHLVNFLVIWYIFWSFGIFCGHLVCCAKKNLATLPAYWREIVRSGHPA